MSFPYEVKGIKDVLPEAQPFSFDVSLPIGESQIVDSITFSQSRVRVLYYNRTHMRIKPNIMGHIFNKDGVIIGSFEDSWRFLSLAPGEREEKSISLSFQVPDELVFSRWASCAYDEKPAWFLLAGSSKQLDDLVKRTESRLRELSTSASLKK